MSFDIIQKDGKEYRKNINKSGNCKEFSDIKCCCCNPDCDHNVSIDDLLEEEMENKLWDFI